jgi:hypothetical protein
LPEVEEEEEEEEEKPLVCVPKERARKWGGTKKPSLSLSFFLLQSV